MTNFENFDVNSVNEMLKEKFAEKMLDSDFLSYVNDLNNEKSYLFINEIEQVINEHKNCNNCIDIKQCPNLIKGHCYNLKNNNGNINEYYVACEKLKGEEYLKNITIFGKTKDNANITTHSNFYRDEERKDILEYINSVIQSKDLTKKGIYLSGSFGTGKSYILSLLIKKLAKEGYKCGFAYFPELLVELKSEFSNNSQSLLERVKKLDVLVIDDIGSEKVTEWSRDEILGTILQYRMDNRLFTCFTSNYNLDQLIKHYNKDKELIKANRIIDRIRFLTVQYELVGKNYRNK